MLRFIFAFAFFLVTVLCQEVTLIPSGVWDVQLDGQGNFCAVVLTTAPSEPRTKIVRNQSIIVSDNDMNSSPFNKVAMGLRSHALPTLTPKQSSGCNPDGSTFYTVQYPMDSEFLGRTAGYTQQFDEVSLAINPTREYADERGNSFVIQNLIAATSSGDKKYALADLGFSSNPQAGWSILDITEKNPKIQIRDTGITGTPLMCATNQALYILSRFVNTATVYEVKNQAVSLRFNLYGTNFNLGCNTNTVAIGYNEVNTSKVRVDSSTYGESKNIYLNQNAAVRSVAVAPDGQFFIGLEDGTKQYVVDQTEKTIGTTAGPSRAEGNIMVHADQYRVYFGNQLGSLKAVPRK